MNVTLFHCRQLHGYIDVSMRRQRDSPHAACRGSRNQPLHNIDESTERDENTRGCETAGLGPSTLPSRENPHIPSRRTRIRIMFLFWIHHEPALTASRT